MAQARGSRPTVSPNGSRRGGLTPAQVFAALDEVRPPHAVLVEESPSSHRELQAAWPITEPDTYFAFGSGGLGWGLPAAVGIALAERDRGHARPVVAIIGDGAFQYSVQSLWTAAQAGLPVLVVVMRNGDYAILKAFAELEHTPGVPGLDLPGLDIVSIAKGFGCDAHRLDDLDAIRRAATNAPGKAAPTVLEIPISATHAPLL